jgi:hypothetical protein
MAKKRTDAHALQALVGAKQDGDIGPMSIASTISFLKNLVGTEAWEELKEGKAYVDWKKAALSAAGVLGAIALTVGLTKKSVRERIVAEAMKELGKQDPDKYWREVNPNMVGSGAHWCGAFDLAILKRAGIAADLDWEQGIGFLMRAINGRQLPATKDPKPGDTAYFSNLQHHAIVKSVDKAKGIVVTIDGNQTGETVKERIRPISEVTAFFSIQPLIDAAGLA